MRKIREVLRLKFEVGLSARQIAVSVQIGRVTVGDYLNRFAASGLAWPCSLSDSELEQQLFHRRRQCPASSGHCLIGLGCMPSCVAPA